ncbi:hypothetical protein C0J52_01172 [Blattella germanica]|nr:hypothetical protein C0J52_01172 [Blattella germanica]
MSQQERNVRGGRRFGNQNQNQRRGNNKSNPNRNYRQQQSTDQHQHYQANDHSVPQSQYYNGRRESAGDRPTGTYHGRSQNAQSYQPEPLEPYESTTSVSKYENVTNTNTYDVELQSGSIDISEKMHIDSKVQSTGSNLKSIMITGPDLAFDKLLQKILETHPDRDLIVPQLEQLPNVRIEMQNQKFQNKITQKTGGNNKKNYKKVQETSGDLFEAPTDYSLAHCVAEDLRMGSGIAVNFRQSFKSVGELLDQKRKVGQVAVLKSDNRYIYYLITKKVSNGKPFIEDLERSLKEMKKHCEEHEVKKLAMPRIGCGLDRLEWRAVKPMIEDIFSDLEIDITVYNYNAEDSKTVSKPKAQFKTVHYPLIDMETKTGLVFFGAIDGNVDECGKDLDKKFKFMLDYQKESKQVGNVLLFEKRLEYLYGFVIKQKGNEAFSYVNVEKCLYELRKRVKKDETYYLGFQAFCVDDDNLTMEKFISVVRNVFNGTEVDIYFCYPKELEYLCVSGEGYGYEGNMNYSRGKKDFTREENRSNMFVGKGGERNKGMGNTSWRTSRS